MQKNVRFKAPSWDLRLRKAKLCIFGPHVRNNRFIDFKKTSDADSLNQMTASIISQGT